MIDGVILTPLQTFADERGAVKKMLRADSPVFAGFGEVYFSTIHPGKVKAWRKHTRMVSNLAVPSGQVRVILFHEQTNEIQEIILGGDNYALLTIPPGVWSGFQGLGKETAVIANCASILHDPDEPVICAVDDPSIPYQWAEGAA